MGTNEFRIPFNKPFLPPHSRKFVEDVLSSPHLHGDGRFSREAEEILSGVSGGGRVFLTASCTQALEMSTLLLGLNPGDEVILPSFTFTSAVTSLVNSGVKPVFVDINLKDLNIDVSLIREAITAKTKAISVVNYGGAACDYEEISKIASEYGLRIIEDNAHGLMGSMKNSPLGSFGDLATLSFHATKNFQCGEGGALIINDKSLLERAYTLREKGTNRKQFLEGGVEKYEWFDKGGSYLLPEVLSGLLLSQLLESKFIQQERAHVWNRYHDELFEVFMAHGWKFSELAREARGSFHNFYLISKKGVRQKLRAYLAEKGIEANAHYQGLHASKAGRQLGRSVGDFSITDMASTELLRLPLWTGMTDGEIDSVISGVKEFTMVRND